MPSGVLENPAVTANGGTATGTQIACRRVASIGSCKHRIWEAIRASSAAPYYLDDFSDGKHCFHFNIFYVSSHFV